MWILNLCDSKPVGSFLYCEDFMICANLVNFFSKKIRCSFVKLIILMNWWFYNKPCFGLSVMHFSYKIYQRKRLISKSSHPEVFLGKGVFKICSKFKGKHSCQSAISIKLQSNFIEIALRHGCSSINLLHIFRIPFLKNTSGRLLLSFPLVVFLCSLAEIINNNNQQCVSNVLLKIVVNDITQWVQGLNWTISVVNLGCVSTGQLIYHFTGYIFLILQRYFFSKLRISMIMF